MSRWKLPMRHGILTLALLGGLTSALWAEEADNWQLLSEATVSEAEENGVWRAEKHFPEGLRAAASSFEISGYLVPVLAEPYIQHFLLVADPDDCPFCGSSGYGPALEVNLRTPLPDLPEFSEITVKGELELIDDPETFQLYRLNDAVAVTDAGS